MPHKVLPDWSLLTSISIFTPPPFFLDFHPMFNSKIIILFLIASHSLPPHKIHIHQVFQNSVQLSHLVKNPFLIRIGYSLLLWPHYEYKAFIILHTTLLLCSYLYIQLSHWVTELLTSYQLLTSYCALGDTHFTLDEYEVCRYYSNFQVYRLEYHSET